MSGPALEGRRQRRPQKARPATGTGHCRRPVGLGQAQVPPSAAPDKQNEASLRAGPQPQGWPAVSRAPSPGQYAHKTSHCGSGMPSVYEAHVRFCVRIAARKCERAFSYGYSLAATPAIAPEHTNAPQAAMSARMQAKRTRGASLAAGCVRVGCVVRECVRGCVRGCVRYQSSRGTAPSLHGASSAIAVRRTRRTGPSADAAHACSAPRCAQRTPDRSSTRGGARVWPFAVDCRS